MAGEPVNPYQPSDMAEPHPKGHGLIAYTVKFLFAFPLALLICMLILYRVFRAANQSDAIRPYLILMAFGFSIALAVLFTSCRTWKYFVFWSGGMFLGVCVLCVIVELVIV